MTSRDPQQGLFVLLEAAVAAAHPGAAELVRVSAVLDGDALLCNDEAGLGATVDLLPPFAGG